MKLTEILHSPVFYVFLTMLCYLMSVWTYRKLKLHYIVPVLISSVMLILYLVFTGTDYNQYMTGGSIILFFLGPATVSLAVPLYRQISLFNRKKFIIVTAGIASGVITALSTVLFLSRMTGLSDSVIRSLFGKSVTMPIAMGICRSAGGIISLTVAGVMVAGITGAVAAPLVLKITCVKHPAAKGAAIGTSSHIIGTVRAFEMGEKEGSVSSISIGIAGIITAFFVPVFILFL